MSDRPPQRPSEPEEIPLPVISSAAGASRSGSGYGQTKRVRPKTYQFAIYLVLAVFVVQGAFFLTIPWFRHQIAIDTRSPEVQRERLRLQNEASSATPAASGAPSRPAPSAPGSTTVVAPDPLKPSLGPARIAVPVDPAKRVDDLVREGYNYMQQGENDLARSALLEAEQISPKDLRILCYQAELAESERDSARATSYWKRIIDLGAAAGPLVDQAKGHIANLAAKGTAAPAPTPAPPAETPAPSADTAQLPAPAPAPTPTPATTSAPQETASAPSAPAESAADTAAKSTAPAPAPAPALLPGAKFFTVLAPTQVAASDGSGFALRIPIVCAVHDGARIDPGKVGIKLYFYDRLPDGAISPTSAKIEVAFEGGRATWQDGRTETLRAFCRRKIDPNANPKTAPVYHGYVFRLTYDNVVQDERSEPSSLLRTVFPATP